MSKSEEFKNLLDSLKKEVPINITYASNNKATNYQTNLNKKRILSNAKMEPLKAFSKLNNDDSKFNVIWSENKETLLFGMLISVIVAVIGILAKVDYIIMTGVISFALFSILSFVAFFRYILIVSREKGDSFEIASKIEVLERKIEVLLKNAENISGDDRYQELADKVEELRVIVKTIAQK